ncbi:MAG: 50S ribosomal protein L4 [Elusimicrobiota bacterium]
METQVWNLKGEEIGKVELPDAIFGVKPSPEFLHEVTTAYLSNQRRGTAHAKTRGEVRGGGRKPWRQKGTGRARQGSIRSPLWHKGGVTFGPRTRSWRIDLPRRKTQKALAQALSVRAGDGSLRVVESLALDGAKTSQVAALLKALKAHKRSLVVTEQRDENLARAARNVPELKVMLVAHLNAYEVLACRNMIISRGALEKLAPRWN